MVAVPLALSSSGVTASAVVAKEVAVKRMVARLLRAFERE
jgi:hypothetical protein